MFIAVATDNLEAIALLASEGSDLPELALHKAASVCSEAALQVLLDLGADVRGLSASAGTALHCAVAEGKFESTRRLILEGADVDAVNPGSRTWDTPLQLAALSCYNTIVALLLEHGANVNAVNKFKCTALHFAACSGNKVGVRLLTAAGASVNLSEQDGRTVLHDCLWMDVDATAIESLLEYGSDLEATNKKGFTPLLLAAHFGNLSATRVLCSEGGNPLARTVTGNTPLHEAAFNGHRRCVEELASRSASTKHSTNARGQTPMALFDVERGPHPWYHLKPSRLRHLSDSEVDRIRQALHIKEENFVECPQSDRSSQRQVQAFAAAVGVVAIAISLHSLFYS
eukprot:GILI01014008.1.p1 GENE.GILI01014008.1~~GILI01014008.1.p1  ORF type:complete len:385 (+),score=53.12 GILI01014008.1:128-1156(+)